MWRDDIFLLVQKPAIRGLLRGLVDVVQEFIDLTLGVSGCFFVCLDCYRGISEQLHNLSIAHVSLHLLGLVGIEEQFGLLISFHLYYCQDCVVTRDINTLTNSFLFTHPSSKAGNSTPFSSVMARNAPSGSVYSAKPKP